MDNDLESLRKKTIVAKFKTIVRNLSGRTGEHYENHGEYRRSSGPDLNPGPPEYKLRLLITRP
jgi:hypothetical protein